MMQPAAAVPLGDDLTWSPASPDAAACTDNASGSQFEADTSLDGTGVGDSPADVPRDVAGTPTAAGSPSSPRSETPRARPSTRPTTRRGRRTQHGLAEIRRDLSRLTTRRLDNRSAVAVAIRRFKTDVTADRGGDLSTSQQALLEQAAQLVITLSAVNDYINRQPSLVTRKRTLLPIIVERGRLIDSLTKVLTAIGLDRKASDVTDDLEGYLTGKRAAGSQ